MTRLAGKVAVVTGASRGTGRGIALVLGSEGATVYVTGRSSRAGGRTEELPGTVDVHAPSPMTDRPTLAAPHPDGKDGETEHLHQAQSMLERELTRTDLAPQEAEDVAERVGVLSLGVLERVE